MSKPPFSYTWPNSAHLLAKANPRPPYIWVYWNTDPMIQRHSYEAGQAGRAVEIAVRKTPTGPVFWTLIQLQPAVIESRVVSARRVVPSQFGGGYCTTVTMFSSKPWKQALSYAMYFRNDADWQQVRKDVFEQARIKEAT